MENFNILDVNELDLAFDDLLNSDFRKEAVALVNGWAIYGPGITDIAKRVADLPEALKRRPLAEALAQTDFRHDALGGTLRSACDAHISDPASTPETVTAAKAVAEAFVPSLSELTKPYATEAAAAKDNKADLATFEKQLKLLPMANGRTLFDVASDFVKAGEDIDGLLTKRTHVQADASTADRRTSARLRSRAVSLLTRFRRAVQEELGLNPALPQDVDARIFGKLDELARLHRERLEAAAQSPGAPPAA